MSKADERDLEDKRKLLEYMGIYPYRRPKTQWSKAVDMSKLAVISDPHEPYSYEPVFRELEAQHKDAGAMFCGGDTGDFYSKSRFPAVHEVKFADELRAVFFRLEWMATHWRQVYVLTGNHDNRPEKKLVKSISHDLDLLIMVRLDLLRRLADFFDNITLVGQRTPNPEITLTHLWQYGDIIFTHAERSMAQKSALMAKLSEQLFKRKGLYRLKPYRVICQGHNHTSSKDTQSNTGETWFMLPSAADPFSVGLEYSHSARMIGNPPCIGYSIFYQEHNVTDVNRSNNFLVP